MTNWKDMKGKAIPYLWHLEQELRQLGISSMMIGSFPSIDFKRE